MSAVDLSAAFDHVAHSTEHPVIEIFGPTVQGEGPDAGKPCAFVRFGACDYRCSWCDSMYAVEPEQVRQAPRLGASAIMGQLDPMLEHVDVVVLSGGNPALHELGPLVARIQNCDVRVSVETQASVWRDWLRRVDLLVMSPKPPSSGMVSDRHTSQTHEFITRAFGESRVFAGPQVALKVVVFDETDLDWALELAGRWPGIPAYLSAGTTQPVHPRIVPSIEAIRADVCDRFRWLCEQTASREVMRNVVVLPQLHVLAWGMARGV